MRDFRPDMDAFFSGPLTSPSGCISVFIRMKWQLGSEISEPPTYESVRSFPAALMHPLTEDPCIGAGIGCAQSGTPTARVSFGYDSCMNGQG